ncbi:MAG: hypothetical protein H0T39_03110 [Actinobacteria bacterium]|nr:hypothetical protein [Actinomycetota bacterium]
MAFVRGFGRFWYDFIVGDDWKIAAGVVAALGITAVLVANEAFGDSALIVIGAAGIVAGFVTSLVVDVRRS